MNLKASVGFGVGFGPVFLKLGADQALLKGVYKKSVKFSRSAYMSMEKVIFKPEGSNLFATSIISFYQWFIPYAFEYLFLQITRCSNISRVFISEKDKPIIKQSEVERACAMAILEAHEISDGLPNVNVTPFFMTKQKLKNEVSPALLEGIGVADSSLKKKTDYEKLDFAILSYVMTNNDPTEIVLRPQKPTTKTNEVGVTIITAEEKVKMDLKGELPDGASAEVIVNPTLHGAYLSLRERFVELTTNFTIEKVHSHEFYR